MASYSLATRLYSDFTLLYINACTCTRYPGLVAYCWPFNSHNCHTSVNIFPTDLLVYCSVIYPQEMTFKYGLGGRLGKLENCVELCSTNMVSERILAICEPLGWKSRRVILNGLPSDWPWSRQLPTVGMIRNQR